MLLSSIDRSQYFVLCGWALLENSAAEKQEKNHSVYQTPGSKPSKQRLKEEPSSSPHAGSAPLAPYCALRSLSIVPTQGVLRDLCMLGERAGRGATRGGAHVPEVLPAAPLEGLGGGLGISELRKPAGSPIVRQDVQ